MMQELLDEDRYLPNVDEDSDLLFYDDMDVSAEDREATFDDELLFFEDDSFGPVEAVQTSLTLTNPASNNALTKIESMFEGIAESMLSGGDELVLRIASRSTTGHTDASPSHVETKMRTLTFPGSTPQDAWRFTAFVKVLELMHEALVTGVVTTKRDIFYKDPALFKNQYIVDRIVDDVSFSLSVPRSALNVVAAAKGLVAGALVIRREGRVTLHGSQDAEGTLIPHLQENDLVDCSMARWVLVVEKEAVFHSLLGTAFWQACADHAIMLTGKGYPDIATRALLRRFTENNSPGSRMPQNIYLLVDYDPHGIGILSNYKHGSASLKHEDASLVVPSIQWLGLKCSDVAMQQEPSSLAVLTLSAADRKKATDMLKWGHQKSPRSDAEMRRELQIMLMLNQKAEIQLLDMEAGGVATWLEGRLW